MKTLLPTFFLLLIFSSPVICQTSLSGKVTDGDTGEELIASNVTLYKNGVLMTGTAADFNGNYKINLDPGTYDVEVSYVGYASSKYNGVVVLAGANNKLNVRLGGSGGRWQQRNIPKRNSKSGFDFHSHEEESGIEEILYNKPKGLTQNNNIEVDTTNENYPTALVDFASKVSVPNKKEDREFLPNRKPIMLALNIPTYLNLYAYGFKNIYELNELINVGDTRIKFEGTKVIKPIRFRSSI